jgi:hypothetical protein
VLGQADAFSLLSIDYRPSPPIKVIGLLSMASKVNLLYYMCSYTSLLLYMCSTLLPFTHEEVEDA